MEMFRLVQMSKSYKSVTALNGITIAFERGKFYSIMGPSGSGKTTLINILAMLDCQSSGDMFLKGRNIKEYTEYEKAKIRNREIGFIFQAFYLLPNFSALENVMIPMYVNEEIKDEDMPKRANHLLETLGVSQRKLHLPSEMSAGEQQRVALARALANDPQVIIADEPTGNLDEENEKYVLNKLRDFAKNGKTVIVVTHNPIVKEYSDVDLHLKQGVLGVTNDKTQTA